MEPNNTSASGSTGPAQIMAPKKAGLKNVLTTIGIILAAPIIAWILVSFVFQSYQVDGESMETTLQNQDRLIVLKVQRTWARITRHTFVPSRGEVVVFIKRGLYEDDQNRPKQLIKRVIGLPGDRVVVKDGVLTVYNKQHPKGFQPDKTYAYGKVITTTTGTVDITVPPGQMFVCGDNRGNSLDSSSFGTLPINDIVGTLALRILPLNKAEAF